MVVRLTRRRLATAVATVLTLAAVTAFGVAPIDESDLPPPSVVRETVDATDAVVGTSDAAVFERHERVQRGDTIGALLARLGVQDDAMFDFVRTNPVARDLMQPQPGRTVSVGIDAAGKLLNLQYAEHPAEFGAQARKLVIDRTTSGALRARTAVANVVRSVAMRSAEVRTSLFAAIDSAGIPDQVAEQVAEIFGSQIDFYRQVRRGDRLRVVYEQVQLAGSLEPPRPGRVLAAEIIDGTRTHRAMWFERTTGRGEYFSFDGKHMKKGFLRSPLEFSRISSGFTEERLHPIWNDVRPHRGIDYAAPIGTKVRAVGDGVVDMMGVQGGYGNVVVIRHPGDVTTLYAHLNDFAPQLRVGQTISQGDVIGEVGRTGWATGPHLHFEFRVAGQHVDPQTIDLPGVRPLDGAEHDRFEQALASVKHQIGLLDSLQVARFE